MNSHDSKYESCRAQNNEPMKFKGAGGLGEYSLLHNQTRSLKIRHVFFGFLL